MWKSILIQCLNLCLKLCIVCALTLLSAGQEVERLDLADIGLDITPSEAAAYGGFTPRETKVLTLAECVELALRQNPAMHAARANERARQAQLRQAKSAYWPHLSLDVSGQIRNDDLTFQQPGGVFEIPAANIPIPATSITLPANALGPGSPAAQFPVAGGSIPLPASRIPFPAQDVTLLDRQLLIAKLGARYLVMDGGGRRAQRRQAEYGVQAAGHHTVSTMLQTRLDVATAYHTAVLMTSLADIAKDFEIRWEGVTDLTKTFYEAGSEMVDKTDYLRSQALQQTVKATRIELESQREQILTGLGNLVGAEWDVRVKPATRNLKLPPFQGNLRTLVGDVYRLNPDWQRMKAGLAAAGQEVRVRASDGRPRLALFADLHRGTTGGAGGLDENIDGWIAGVGVEIPVFDGRLNRNKLREARARLEERTAQSLQLERGLATLMKQHVQAATYAERRVAQLEAALETAIENSDLNDRAYQAELVEAKDVYESVLFEVFLEVALQQAQHQALLTRARIHHLVGQTLQTRIF